MAKAVLHLREIHQGTQTDATGDDELGARIVFDVEVAGSLVAVGQIANVKTPAGASSDMTLEVILDEAYSGPPLRYDQMRECMEQYYRRLVPPVPLTAKNVVQKCNLYQADLRCEGIDLTEDSGAW